MWKIILENCYSHVSTLLTSIFLILRSNPTGNVILILVFRLFISSHDIIVNKWLLFFDDKRKSGQWIGWIARNFLTQKATQHTECNDIFFSWFEWARQGVCQFKLYVSTHWVISHIKMIVCTLLIKPFSIWNNPKNITPIDIFIVACGFW